MEKHILILVIAAIMVLGGVGIGEILKEPSEITGMVGWTEYATSGECSEGKAIRIYDCGGQCGRTLSRISCDKIPDGVNLGEVVTTVSGTMPSCPPDYVATGFDCAGSCNKENMQLTCKKLINGKYGEEQITPEKQDQQVCNSRSFVKKLDCDGDCGTQRMRAYCTEVLPSIE